MCYSIPGKVVRIEGRQVTVEYFGEPRRAISEMPDLNIGDYVYAQGGFVIQRIPACEADSVLAFWKETFFELQERDLQLSRLQLDGSSIDRSLLTLFDRALEERPVTDDDLERLLSLEAPNEIEYLFRVSNFLRHKRQGNSCCVHGIVEFSSHCSGGCLYCGLSTCNTSLPRYRLDREALLNTVREAVETWGFKTLILQSGEDAGRSIDELVGLIGEIHARWPVLLFISVGEIGIDGLRRCYEAGARGLLMRFETSNPALYMSMRPGRCLEDRLAQLRAAHGMGYLLITGGLVGLPGQTTRDLVKDIRMAVSLQPDMFSFGPLVPHPATPLAKTPCAGTLMTRKLMAACRIAEPRDTRLVVTTAFETLEPRAREMGLTAGANSLMLNLTPESVRPAYDLYPGRAHVNESVASQIEDALALLNRLGRAPTDLGAGSGLGIGGVD
ncbi:MAG TPA: HypC/HybG/HupF family hydrogenase formation chaperone, partial [Candidatus Ozemobacteraceae bacterium]|nr:HypC/HybG/HupF family hydrogenase formation chaperone [Candidatus Ozemobacteraceae bacterium]